MTHATTNPYRVRPGDMSRLVKELDRVFDLISDRLDRIEGLRGVHEVHSNIILNVDAVFTGTSRGVILKDAANPSHYWRVTVDAGGNLDVTNLGRSYV